MSETFTVPQVWVRPKPERPRMHRVILLNDDFTPRDFVIIVLKSVFRMSVEQAHGVMLAAHQKGLCIVAVYTREVAESKAEEATEMGWRQGYPLTFTTQPED